MKNRNSVLLLFGLFLISDITQAATAQEWGGMKSQRAVAPATMQTYATPAPPIISDPVGDHITFPGNPIVDIGTVEGETNGTSITIKIHFSSDTVMSGIAGYIDLDTDQNVATGMLPNANLVIPGAAQDIGVDFFLSLFNLPFGGSIDVVNPNNGILMGSVPATIARQSLEITVPLTMLGGDDGSMDVGMLLGNLFQPTDVAPNEGHGTIHAAGKAIISPGSSTLVTTQVFDVVFIIDAFGQPIIDVSIFLDGADITAAVLGFPPVMGSAQVGRLTARLPEISATRLGPGSHTLSAVFVTPDGVFGDTVMYEIISNTEP